MEKTVMEWLGEVKLYNKKIEKKQKELYRTELFCACLLYTSDAADDLLAV